MIFQFEIKDTNDRLQRFAQKVNSNHTLEPSEAIQAWLDEMFNPIHDAILAEEAINDPEVIAKKTAYDQELQTKLEALKSQK